jgi:NAD-dependent dihydropyrimidine dehydrogenase PreA subunit
MNATAPRVVLYEGAGSRPFEGDTRLAILRTLLQRGYPVARASRARDAEPPMAPASQGRDAANSTAVVVLGRFDEPPPARATADGGAAVHFHDVDGMNADAVVALVEGVRATGQPPQTARVWKPWFPVIDYSRCTNCMQCLTFCLFDVYGVSKDRQIRVANPSNCKTDCPACSRVCPEVAILFPKYKAGPINGAEVRQEDVSREKMKVDISALLGGDIYAALRQRSQDAKARFARERDEKRALDERRKCLTKLQQQLEIPPEVLAALPTLEQIQAKVARVSAPSIPAGEDEG